MIATFGTLILQVTVLLVASALLFKVSWGQPLPMILVATIMIVLAASFGLFVTSLLKDTRQSGIVYGGVLTMMGMVGMIGIFTGQVPGATGGAFEAVSLLVPQGWAVRAWQLIQAGGGIGDVLVTLLVMLGLAAVFFAVVCSGSASGLRRRAAMRVIDLAIKDLTELVRDWKAALFLVIMPIAFTLLFALPLADLAVGSRILACRWGLSTRKVTASAPAC